MAVDCPGQCHSRRSRARKEFLVQGAVSNRCGFVFVKNAEPVKTCDEHGWSLLELGSELPKML